MKIEFEQRGECSLIRVQGRLDATWADHFSTTLMGKIREGQHWLAVDASQLDFLSSAGIRALMQIYKELSKVKGQFWVINPAPFVDQTLRSSGLGMWLDVDSTALPPAANTYPDTEAVPQVAPQMEYFELDAGARLHASIPATWRPWEALNPSTIPSVTFPRDSIALGIGAPQMPGMDTAALLGDFLAVAGNVVFQPAQEQTPADYLLAEESFIPQLECAQVLQLQGQMAHLLRFAPTDTQAEYTLAQLLDKMTAHCAATAVGFVILGEIDGLVGAHLIQSPGALSSAADIQYPAIREWLSFCGERSYAGEQALIVGVAATRSGPLLPQLESAPAGKNGMAAAHMHATVFPRQPLQNGILDMHDALLQFLNAAPPKTVMHLVEDKRPMLGLGESALVRGACWFSAIQNPEVLA
ncbi:MAG: STAS domain-containing protein [Desulfuromonas sp.]|nr:STAS domain-containing protein [Desulfuromonas sp.]